LALEINSRDGIDQVGPGIWRLGDARQGPVILARSLSTLVRAPKILDGFRVKGASLRVITPKPMDQTAHPFAPDIEWLPLQERFAFYGDGISFIAPHVKQRAKLSSLGVETASNSFHLDVSSSGVLPEISGVFYMDIIYEIPRRHLIQKQTITAIARDMGLSRPTVRKHLKTVEEPKYEREQPDSPN
jgi:hypothetical protein